MRVVPTHHPLRIAVVLVAVLLGATACASSGDSAATSSGPSRSPSTVVVPPLATASAGSPSPSSPLPSPSPSAAAFDLTGDWSGTWANRTPDNSVGTFTISWTQEANGVLAGSIVIRGTPCLTGGTITGKLQGNLVSFGVVEGQAEVNYAGTVTLDGKKMGGTYATPCGKAEGTWAATRK